MDKSFIFFLIAGGVFFYFIMNVVKDTEVDNDPLKGTYQKENRYTQYLKKDSIGEQILDVSYVDPKTQVKAWKASPLKAEFLDIFPDFDTMKGFVKNRVRGDELVRKLTNKINEVEDKFFSGTMNAEQAKQALEQL
jgi:hypothetical protein